MEDIHHRSKVVYPSVDYIRKANLWSDFPGLIAFSVYSGAIGRGNLDWRVIISFPEIPTPVFFGRPVNCRMFRQVILTAV